MLSFQLRLGKGKKLFIQRAKSTHFLRSHFPFKFDLLPKFSWNTNKFLLDQALLGVGQKLYIEKGLYLGVYETKLMGCNHNCKL